MAGYISKNFKILKDKISVVPNLIDTEIFTASNEAPLFNRRVIFVGRLTKEKNLFSLLKACKMAGVGLDLIGEGELLAQLKDAAERINTDVHFLGKHDNAALPAIISKYPVFILPSFYEGNPKALLEAMSCERGVIGTDVDGIREIIIDGKNGILCDVSPEGISSAISTLIGDRDLCRKLGSNARKHIMEHYSADKILDAEQKIYKGVLNGVNG